MKKSRIRFVLILIVAAGIFIFAVDRAGMFLYTQTVSRKAFEDMTDREIRITRAQVTIRTENADSLLEPDVLVFATKNENAIQGMIPLGEETEGRTNLIPGDYYIGSSYIDDVDFTVDSARQNFIVTVDYGENRITIREGEKSPPFSWLLE